jgi:cell wall-associated NlpC family hydrolase
MNTPRRLTTVAGLFVFLIGLLASLLTPLPVSEAPTTVSLAETHRTSWIPSVPEPVPDSARNFVQYRHNPDTPPVVPSVRVPTEPTKPATSIRTVSKSASSQRTTGTPVPPKSGTAVETAIAYAMSKLGKPYVWGATGPNAFDCSGLVQAAFHAAGISLPRTTRTIISRGTPVSRSALQRGDLIWPSAGHMGIYLGDGMFIHAPQPGEVVKISKVYAFYAARRL